MNVLEFLIMVYFYPLVYSWSTDFHLIVNGQESVCLFTCESCWFSHSAVLVVGGDDALAWALRSRRHEELV